MFCVWPHFEPTTLSREKNPSEKFLLLPTAGIKPGPPAQQASTLLITPLLLGPKQLLCVNAILIYESENLHRMRLLRAIA